MTFCSHKDRHSSPKVINDPSSHPLPPPPLASHGKGMWRPRAPSLLSHTYRQPDTEEGWGGVGGKKGGFQVLACSLSPKGARALSGSPGLCNRICKQHLCLCRWYFYPPSDVRVAKGNRNSGLNLAASKPFKRQGGVVPQRMTLPVF